jgi:hypothetical protein
MKRPRIEVNLKELDQVLEGARQAPLTDPDYEKLKTALHVLVDALTPSRTTEKTNPVLGKRMNRPLRRKRSRRGPKISRLAPRRRGMDAMEALRWRARRRWRPNIGS